MDKNDPYLSYWREQQKQQDKQNQYLAQQARKNLETIIDYLTKTFPIKKIILFGSLVKNKFTETSDIDLAVEGIPPALYFSALAQVNALGDRWIDLKPLEDLNPHFLQRVMETGEVLYASEDSE
ncbi:MAG: nucleotidyltransferase family protein [Synechocystis sp.]|jgi:predicted nucleotidyltransferase